MARERKTTGRTIGAFEILACVAIVALMIISVNCYVRKYELSYRSEILENEYEEVYNEGERLKVEYQKLTDYSEVSEYAETVLGMKKISEYQLIYMQTDKADEMTVVSSHESFADKITKTFSVVLEYLN